MHQKLRPALYRRLLQKAIGFRYDDFVDRQPVYRFLGPVTIGRGVIGWKDVAWGGLNQVNSGTVLDGDVEVGLGTRLGYHSLVAGQIQIGRYGSLGAHVALIGGGGHPLRTPALYTSSPLYDGRRRALTGDDSIRIGHDVWIGHGTTVLGGVTIGNGAIIGANSVVTGDVSPFSIVAGSPSRFIRSRFPDDVVAALERFAWWELHPDQLAPYEDLLAADLVTDPAAAVAALTNAAETRPTPRDPAPPALDRERFGAFRRASRR